MFYHAPDPGVTAAGSVWARYAVVIHGGDSLANAVAGGVAVIAGSDAVSATAGSGVVGGGVNKSTANATGLNVGNPAKAGALADNNEFSLSGWFKRTGSGTAILAGSRTSWNSQSGFLWLQEKSDRISVASGMADCCEHFGDDYSAIFRRADTRMYENKREMKGGRLRPQE